MAQSRALHPAPCFNTQPPEGGCPTRVQMRWVGSVFQHTAARRRLLDDSVGSGEKEFVSTHSRPKAAAHAQGSRQTTGRVSTHSRPKAAAEVVGVTL